MTAFKVSFAMPSEADKGIVEIEVLTCPFVDKATSAWDKPL